MPHQQRDRERKLQGGCRLRKSRKSRGSIKAICFSALAAAMICRYMYVMMGDDLALNKYTPNPIIFSISRHNEYLHN